MDSLKMKTQHLLSMTFNVEENAAVVKVLVVLCLIVHYFDSFAVVDTSGGMSTAATDIFGDLSEFLDQKKSSYSDEEEEAGLEAEAAAKPVKTLVDPSVAARHHVTEQDELIRQTDIPERMQRYFKCIWVVWYTIP